jgi:ATP adenylyltransferase
MSAARHRLVAGKLWQRVRQVSNRALASGALVPIATEAEELADGGVVFRVRVAASLRRKDAQRRAALDSAFDPGARVAERPNPFLPFDEALYVGDVSEGHVVLLNKFNVVERHLLVVTREFADQRELITAADFAALWACLREEPGAGERGALGFYNGGEEAGASQAHKHLQVVPLPLGLPPDGDATGPAVPMEPALEEALARARDTGGVVTAAGLPFAHAVAAGPEGVLAADTVSDAVGAWLLRRYRELLAAVGLPVVEGEGERETIQPGPYNLLVTRRWMLLVPRLAERFGCVSLNGLAFAGSLFVRDRAQLEALRAAGPLQALGAVCGVRRAP